MVNEKNEAFTIKFKPSLMEKVEVYVNTVNKHKKASEKKLTKANFFNDVVNDYFKEKVLTNDYIELERPFYFNMMELKEEGIVKATTIKPIKDLEKTFVLFNVPNNLDSFNAEANSYCYEDNINLHRGYYYMDYILDLVFSYDSDSKELEIAISNDRDIYFTSEQKEEKEKLVTEREIYVPELELNVIVGYDGLNMLSYSKYKYYVLERDEREKEDRKAIEEYERQEEEFYKNQ